MVASGQVKPEVAYEDVMSGDVGLKKWLVDVATYGFGFVKGVPATVKATEELARRVTFIRETIFGVPPVVVALVWV